MNIHSHYFSAYCRTCNSMKEWHIPKSAFEESSVIVLDCPTCKLEQFVVKLKVTLEQSETRRTRT